VKGRLRVLRSPRVSETRFTLRCALALAVALVFSAHAQERGRLLDVLAGGDAASSAIELVGDRPLSFTTLKLSGPPRVVVDFADTELSGAPAELAVDDGTIRRVASAAAGSRTARVVIELAADAEFDVRAHGSSVEVRVPRIAPLVAKLEAPLEQQPSPSRPLPEPEPTPEAKKRASLPTVSLIGPRKSPEDHAAQERKLVARRAVAEQRLADQRAAEQAAAQRRADRLAAKRAAAERAAADQRAAAQRRADRLAAKRAAADAARLRAEAAKKRPAPQRKLALAEPPPHRAITGIGFRPNQGGEVIVRSDKPLEYGVSGDGNSVLLHLPRAGIPLPNNRRPLDTRYFGGPVERVVPLPVPGGTDVRIELRRHAEYQLAQSGSVLTVTFAAPRP
jgi:hypothetical protein